MEKKSRKPKVQFVFIGTGDYWNFLPGWYESIDDKLFGYENEVVKKSYDVYGDGNINAPGPPSFICNEVAHKEWPYITLERFDTVTPSYSNAQYFNMRDDDWIIFLDADTRVVADISLEEFFGDALNDPNKKYIGVHHPCHYLKFPPHDKYPGAFETNPLSKSAINEEDWERGVYFQGCLWGARVSSWLTICNELSDRIYEEHKNKVIAKWHDESHLNKFFMEHFDEVHVLGPEYAYPEVFADACVGHFEPKIVHLAKDNSKYQK